MVRAKIESDEEKYYQNSFFPFFSPNVIWDFVSQCAWKISTSDDDK